MKVFSANLINRPKVGAKSWAPVTAYTIAVFPLEAVKYLENFTPIVLLTFYNSPNFVL